MENEDLSIEFLNQEHSDDFRRNLTIFSETRFISKPTKNHLENVIWISDGLTGFRIQPDRLCDNRIVLTSPKYSLKITSFPNGVVDVENL